MLYPAAGFTKGEVIDYYTRIAARSCCRTCADRPLTRIRYPNGVDAPGFFEKNAPGGMPVLGAARDAAGRRARRCGRETIDYVVVDGLACLVWLANLAALELHVPQWKVGSATAPDLLVVDLDPGRRPGWPSAAEVARAAARPAGRRRARRAARRPPARRACS